MPCIKRTIKHIAEKYHRCEKMKGRVQRSAFVAHLAYYGGVFIEGHGFYPIVAGVLALVVLIEGAVGE